MAKKSDLPPEVQQKWTLPKQWADCSEEQQEMVTLMLYEFSRLSGLTEPESWATKVKMWHNPMVAIMNATGWDDAGMRRAVRVMRRVIGQMVSVREVVSTVRSIEFRTCNMLGTESYSRSDFPGMSRAEFVTAMRERVSNEQTEQDFSTLQKQADLYARMRERLESVEGDTIAEKLERFASQLYGDEDEQ